MTIYLRFIRYLLRYRVRLGVALICSALVAAMTGAYAWLVRPVLDEIFINRDKTLLILLPVVLLVVSILKALFNYGQTYLTHYVGSRIMTDIRQDLFVQILRLPVGYHDATTSGRLMSHVINDVGMMGHAGAGLLRDLFQQSFTCLAMLCVIFYQNWRLALASIVVAPLSIIIIAKRGSRLRKIASKGQEKASDMSSSLSEAFSGIREVKAFGAERSEADRFAEINKGFFSNSMKAVQVSTLTASQLEVIGIVGVAAIIWYGGYLVITGAMTTGAFFSFLAAMFMAYAPLRRLSTSNATLQQAVASAERVFMVLDLPNEHQKDEELGDLRPIAHSLELRNVTFVYDGAKVPALESVNLMVRAGEVVAFVGSSGSGKSTLINLVLRFYEPTNGVILVDGHNVRDYTIASLRRQTGIVSQSALLFDDTVRSNIAYGRSDATMEEIEAAACAAYAHEFIQRLPNGYETMVGENGVKLSGGERQRIAIARAVLRDPPILILDEATSALDSESERIVQMAISNVMKNRTTLVIAHRLSTVQSADRIIVMEHGRIVEVGSHADLLAQEGVYQRLHSIQFQDVGR